MKLVNVIIDIDWYGDKLQLNCIQFVYNYN